MQIVTMTLKDKRCKPETYDAVIAYQVSHGFIQLGWHDNVKKVIALDDYKCIDVRAMTDEEVENCTYPGYKEWLEEQIAAAEKAAAAQEAALQ